MKRQELTESDLYRPGHAIRISDICAIAGVSRWTVLAEMERGRLKGFRWWDRPGSPWLFERATVVAWWEDKKRHLPVAC